MLGAFLDAVRWGTVASADDQTLQAPFRAGIAIEDYQLEPVAKALTMPRVNLLVADDVGLGKTIEAGLVIQEMLLRHRARRVVVVCPAPLTVKWREEMAEKFGLGFSVLDAAALKQLRRTHGLQANPFQVFPRVIISLAWLRTPRVQRLLDEVLSGREGQPPFVDVLVVDEAHHCAPASPTRAEGRSLDTQQTAAVRRLGEHAQHRLFLSATPHNGHPESWQALLEMLDPRRFARGVEPDPALVQQVMVRRLKDELRHPDGSPRFPGREARSIDVPYTDDEREGHALLTSYVAARQQARGRAASRAGDLVSLLLKKRLFSSPFAFARTLEAHAESVRRADGTQPSAEEDLPDWLSEALAWDDDDDGSDGATTGDEEAADDDGEADLLARAGTLTGEPPPEAQRLLGRAADVGGAARRAGRQQGARPGRRAAAAVPARQRHPRHRLHRVPAHAAVAGRRAGGPRPRR